MSEESQRAILSDLTVLLAELEDRKKYRAIDFTFPAEGKYARSNYPNHMALIKAGSWAKERAFIAPNRVGKTYVASREVAYHLTGLYPDWWDGKRFNHPITAWCAGTTTAKTVEIVQEELLGPINNEGSKAVPKDCFAEEPKSWPGVSGGRISAVIKHHTNGKHDGNSRVMFKSYDQGRRGFEGKAVEVVWFDEEPPMDVYSEGLTRTATTDGLVLSTFTPLNGVSDVFLSFLPDLKFPEDGKVTPPEGMSAYKFVIGESWNNEFPHLSEDQKRMLMASYAPWEMSARTQGMPTLGAGAVYPVDLNDVQCKPFEIPDFWPKFCGLDVGWKKTAAVWLAYDPQSQTYYAYNEYYRGQAEAPIHAEAIKARGSWIPTAIDPASNTPTQTDGDTLFQLYVDLGLQLIKAKNAVTANIVDILNHLSTGRLRIFTTLENTVSEMRMYRYDDKGRVVKKNDHLMDALRYAMSTGRLYARCLPDEEDESVDKYGEFFNNSRNLTTGY